MDDRPNTIISPDDLTPAGRDSPLVQAGQLANRIAGAAVFGDYRSRKAANTVKRQDNDLALFGDYLRSIGLPSGDFAGDPQAWSGVSWGLVAGFVRWLLAEGYAVSSVNVRLSSVKTYAALAAQAGALVSREPGWSTGEHERANAEAYAMIRTVKGFQRDEAKHLDENREITRREVRRNGVRAGKKAAPVRLLKEQAAALKGAALDTEDGRVYADQLKKAGYLQPDTPQGRRDALLMCLMLEHGLRVGEVAGLTVDCFDLKSGELRFYRPKVHKVQRHKLTADTLQAAKAYLVQDAPALGRIWRGSLKDGSLEQIRTITRKDGRTYETGYMGARAITERVKDLGAAIGVKGLSAHDLRHFWTTRAARKSSPFALQEAGGWSSLAMPRRYIEEAKIANEGIRLE